MPKNTASRTASSLSRRDLVAGLRALEERLLWLSAWTIHNANHLRENRDGLKVGGHQASCASMTTLMSALYFHALRPQDRVAVKPHASPVLHAIEYLFGRQDRDQLERFRAFGGAQSYPSRTKDQIRVDFSTGSVGLGVAVTAFSSLVQDMHLAAGRLKQKDAGRFISLLGDAELDEGNIYEALIEAHKHRIRNTWWIVDYNRQSLDATTPGLMFDRFDDIFETMGWEVIALKYGRAQRALFRKRGGAGLREWIDACPNDLYSALTFEGGEAWRERLEKDLEGSNATLDLIGGMSDVELSELMTGLGGHCMDSLLEAYEKAAASETPKFIIAYTIKGRNLPFQGHKDNHAGLMNPTQITQLREALGVVEGEEWEPLAGLDTKARAAARKVLKAAPFAKPLRARECARVGTPTLAEFPTAQGTSQSTQAAFGRFIGELAKQEGEFARRIVTTSPDVTVSTNLGGFVNRRGLFAREAGADVFRELKIASPQIWRQGPDGQHIELGIAENNLFLMLAALGLSTDHFGETLLPVGTLYDPFIARGLDALNYAVYQDARFILVATPSGLTLAPEGGAHQSVSSAVIGMAQPGLTTYEPAFADELAVILHRAFERIVEPNGGSTYLRLSTRTIDQPQREMSGAFAKEILDGAYWLKAPDEGAEMVLAFSGALAPEALKAWDTLREDIPGIGLLNVTSGDRLHAEWTRSGRAVWTGEGVSESHVENLLRPLAPDSVILTLTDGAPHALSWLGGVRGHRVAALGVERFGQSGELEDLYREYRLDEFAVLDAAATILGKPR